MLTCDLDDGQLDRLFDFFQVELTQMEQQVVHCAFNTRGEGVLSPVTVANTSLSAMLTQRRNSWLTDLIQNKRLFTAFQPIVKTKAGQVTSIFGYECLLRARDAADNPLPPAQVFTSARAGDLLHQIDLAARCEAVEAASDAGIEQYIFINFNPAAIYDPAHCLESTRVLIDSKGIAPGRVVFEIVESEHVGEIGHLHSILDYYRKHGFLVAMDDLGSGFSSMRLLSELRPDFVKLDMDLIRNVHKDPWKAVITSHMIEVAHDLKLPVIAEGIECIEEALWLEEHGAEYQQGFLHGRPQMVPETLSRMLERSANA